jgi:Lrp/AsnC family transcriptional regulator for asnA, asnC and gidA
VAGEGDPARLDRTPLRLAVEMSDVDRAIIRSLQADGRRPYAQIASELGVAEKTVRRRVQELRANGVIEITTVTDPELLGYGAIALLGLRLAGSRPVSEVAAELAQLEAVDYVVVTTGGYDLFVEVLCRDWRELLRTVEREVFPTAGVREHEIFPYLRFHYQEPRWEAARWKSPDGRRGSAALALDEVDHAILLELNADGRVPLQRVARKLAAPLSQVRQRVARMVGSGAVRVIAITNPTSLGFTTMAWLGIQAAPGVRVEALAEHVSSLASIAYVVVCAGRFDVFAEAICVDREDLFLVLDDQVRPLPGVARVETFLYLDLHYKRLRPPQGQFRTDSAA